MPTYDPYPTDAELSELLATTGEPLSHYASLPGAPSTMTMLRAIDAGELPATRDGRRFMVHRNDFAAWITARRGGDAA
ncbi:helix-turn-helix domain-containing protein [Gordonia amicalis]|uniref:helix-turn-helix domain-containing protein n=1 Tax=Gordonia amicalis TaxID=89053 RepID=UPI0024BAD9FB|nr:helix-turn-helix domain-containing protein [Gordonia amicalis]MDJ0454069.1 helix-turn-helix domain-containing protein [Gordonia amicalis]MDV7077213.1 helix-turn-helix domain-containing protein [Gordonia amicalis]